MQATGTSTRVQPGLLTTNEDGAAANETAPPLPGDFIQGESWFRVQGHTHTHTHTLSLSLSRDFGIPSDSSSPKPRDCSSLYKKFLYENVFEEVWNSLRSV